MIQRYKPNLRVADFISYLCSPKVTMSVVEQDFARKANCKYALMLPYGRSAYYFLLKCYNHIGREVIMPAYTCSSLAGPVTETGNVPIFVDASPNGYNMIPSQIAGKITDRTKMILFSEIWGDPIDSEVIEHFKDKNILLIGDYSLSLLNYLDSAPKKLRSLDAAFFSFGLGKEISVLGGGIIITDDEALFNKVKAIRDTTCVTPGFLRSLKLSLKLFASVIAFSKLFYKSVMYLSERTVLLNQLKSNDANAATNLPDDFFILPNKLQLYLIKARLDHSNELIAERQQVLVLYYDALKEAGITDFYPFKLASYLAIKCDEKTIKNLQRKFFASNIHTSTVYKRSLPEITGQDIELYPNAKNHTKNITMLPVFYGITEKEIKKTVRVLKANQKNIDAESPVNKEQTSSFVKEGFVQ